MKRGTVLLIFVLYILPGMLFAQYYYKPGEQKTVIIPKGQSRSFMFTNSLGLFYYGETGQENSSKYHGLSYLTNKFLEDYRIEIGGSDLDRTKSEAKLFANKLIRTYQNLSIEEEVSIADSLPVLIVQISSKQRAPMVIEPIIPRLDRKQEFVQDWEKSEKILYTARKHHLVRNDEDNYPVWVGVFAYPESEFSDSGFGFSNRESELKNSDNFIPGKINVYLENKAYIFFILGDSKKEILQYRDSILKKLKIQIQKPTIQIEGIRQV